MTIKTFRFVKGLSRTPYLIEIMILRGLRSPTHPQCVGLQPPTFSAI